MFTAINCLTMKILAFSDIHGDLSTLERFKKVVKQKKIDVVLCAGDFTFFENHIEIMMKKLSELGTEVLLIHGNHEYDEVVKILVKKYKNLHFIHKKAKKIGDFIFIGYGGGGFSLKDSEFVKTMKDLTNHINKKEALILMTHAPFFGTKLDIVPGYGHVGNKDYRKFIESNKVVLGLAGHIHECFGKIDKLGRALLISPGYKGKIITLE